MDESGKKREVTLHAQGLRVSDPDHVLSETPIFFAFPKSKSPNFPIALGLAKSSKLNGVQEVEGRLLYWAAFTLSTQDLELAAELLRIAGSWVGTFARIYGKRVIHPHLASHVLRCYQEGSQCVNHVAHCHATIDDPLHKDYDPESHRLKAQGIMPGWMDDDCIEVDEFVSEFSFPCKIMLETSPFHPPFKFNRAYGVTLQEQIDAKAVEYGINICPLFNAFDFRQVGSRRRVVRIPVTEADSNN